MEKKRRTAFNRPNDCTWGSWEEEEVREVFKEYAKDFAEDIF